MQRNSHLRSRSVEGQQHPASLTVAEIEPSTTSVRRVVTATPVVEQRAKRADRRDQAPYAERYAATPGGRAASEASGQTRPKAPYADRDRRARTMADKLSTLSNNVIETVSGHHLEWLHGHGTGPHHHRGDRPCPRRPSRPSKPAAVEAARAGPGLGTPAPLPRQRATGALGRGRPPRREPEPARRPRRSVGRGVRARRPRRRPRDHPRRRPPADRRRPRARPPAPPAVAPGRGWRRPGVAGQADRPGDHRPLASRPRCSRTG